MIVRMRRCILLLLALGLSAVVGAAEPERPKLKLRDAEEQVRQETGGRILSAQTVGHGKNQVYRIKVLTAKGSVRVVQVPTRTEK
jgi:hypothetical protein